MVTQTPSRDELARALRTAGCRIDLDTALADLTIARLLELVAENTLRAAPASAPDPDPDSPIARRMRYLRRLVGDIDRPRLQAGDPLDEDNA